jgi:YtcA family
MMQMGRRKIGFTYLLAAVGPFSLLAGCASANNIEVVGSYFPYWLLCMVVGVSAAFASRILFVRLKIEPYLGPLTLIYVCVMVGVACLAWLII